MLIIYHFNVYSLKKGLTSLIFTPAYILNFIRCLLRSQNAPSYFTELIDTYSWRTPYSQDFTSKKCLAPGKMLFACRRPAR